MSEKVNIAIIKLSHAGDLPLPGYMSEGASGLDLYAAVERDIIIRPKEYRLIPTGIAMAIPTGYEGQVRPRSGLAYKHGITVLNAPGTIDADYRGEIKVLLINHGSKPYTISRGERIAQLIIQPVPRVKLVEVDRLPPSQRGDGGFGHTGYE